MSELGAYQLQRRVYFALSLIQEDAGSTAAPSPIQEDAGSQQLL